MKLNELLFVAYAGFALFVALLLAMAAWLSRARGQPTGNEWAFAALFVALLITTIAFVKSRNPK